MTLSVLLNHHSFDTVIPFLPKKEMGKLNIDLFQFREAYDLLRSFVPQHPACFPIYAGYFTRKDGQWTPSLKFPFKTRTFEDVGRQVIFLPGGSLIPAELIANCLIEYLSQSKPEHIHNAAHEPLVVPSLCFRPYQKSPLSKCPLSSTIDRDTPSKSHRIKSYRIPQAVLTEQARIQKAHAELSNQWKDLLSSDQLSSVMRMAHGMILTYRDLSGNDKPLSYIIQSIQRYTTISPSYFNMAFCKLSHPQFLGITPKQEYALSDALIEWLGHDNLQINQIITDDPSIRCQLLLVALDNKESNF